MDVRLLFLFSYWKEGFTSVIFLPLYFSFKFSIRSLPSFEDLPFSAPTLGEEDFIHLSAVLLLIKPYIKKLKVKVLLGNSFFICIITCCKRKSKERNWRRRLVVVCFLFLVWRLAQSIQKLQSVINLASASEIDKRSTGWSLKLTRDFQKKKEVN